MKQLFFVLVSTALISVVSAQNKTENLVIVTLDGMRWQEVFGGADSDILKNKKFTKDSSGTSGNFWMEDWSGKKFLNGRPECKKVPTRAKMLLYT